MLRCTIAARCAAAIAGFAIAFTAFAAGQTGKGDPGTGVAGGEGHREPVLPTDGNGAPLAGAGIVVVARIKRGDRAGLLSATGTEGTRQAQGKCEAGL